jgi:hypothetical protein
VTSRRLNLEAEGAFALIAEALTVGRELWLDAAGESMYPVVPSGSRVLLVPRRRAPRTGDIVLVRGGDRLILHRVRAVTSDRLVTGGDASPTSDVGIPHHAALGLAVACDDGRGIRPLAPFGRWFGVLAVARWARAELHRLARSWRR